MKRFALVMALAFAGLMGAGDAFAGKSPSPHSGALHPTYGHVRTGIPFMSHGRSYRFHHGRHHYRHGRRHFRRGHRHFRVFRPHGLFRHHHRRARFHRYCR